MNPPDSEHPNQRRGKRISAPLLDRIDLTIPVDSVAIADLQGARPTNAETSSTIRKRVISARTLQLHRFGKDMPITNAAMDVPQIDHLCQLSGPCAALLCTAANKLGLSARAYHRTIKVARTIADLGGSEEIQIPHIAEALQYRTGNAE
jgi:magnesium chelatase family protein